jgi:tetratricopeptide (TPR) repeat protein
MIRPSRAVSGLVAALSFWLAVGAVTVSVGVVRPGIAAAGDDDDDDDDRDDRAMAAAKKRYYKGEKLFALGRFKEALVEYEAAFEASPLPEFLFNIGQCHRNLGDFRSAVFSFRKYIRLRPEADNRDAVEKLIADLEREIAEADDRRPDGPIPPPTGPRRQDESRPVYKKWWFWTGVVAVGAGTAALVYTLRGDGLPDSDLGNVDFGR